MGQPKRLVRRRAKVVSGLLRAEGTAELAWYIEQASGISLKSLWGMLNERPGIVIKLDAIPVNWAELSPIQIK